MYGLEWFEFLRHSKEAGSIIKRALSKNALEASDPFAVHMVNRELGVAYQYWKKRRKKRRSLK